jgi:hypothetical protein
MYSPCWTCVFRWVNIRVFIEGFCNSITDFPEFIENHHGFLACCSNLRQHVLQIQELKQLYFVIIEDPVYIHGRTEILDKCIRTTDRQENLALKTTRLQRLNSFLPHGTVPWSVRCFSVSVEKERERTCLRHQHPPIFRQCPVPLLRAPLAPSLPGVFGRGSFLRILGQPPHDLPAAVRKKPYEAIHPHTLWYWHAAQCQGFLGRLLPTFCDEVERWWSERATSVLMSPC